MFKLFTKPARAAVVAAHEEARLLKHKNIGCEHVLLGLLRQEEGLTAPIFKAVDATPERVRAQVARAVGADTVGADEVSFTAEAKTALELSVHEALSLSHHFVGCEHILLGLLRDEEDLLTRSLSLLEVDAQQLRRAATKARRPGRRFASCPQPNYLADYARSTSRGSRPSRRETTPAQPRSDPVRALLA